LIRIVIADDQPSVRVAVRSRLDLEEDLAVVAEATDGVEAVAQVGDAQPDLVVLDYQMPRTDGLQAARSISRSHPDVAMVMLTAEANPELVAEAGRAGIRGYVLKSEPPETLVDAIRVVADGGHRVPGGDTVVDLTEEPRAALGRRRSR
jgi:two-component system, NarL family, response regulator DesR